MRLLVVLDESAASRRTETYIAKMAGRRRGLRLCLAPVSLSWFREVVRGDLARELVRRGEGFIVWVVE